MARRTTGGFAALLVGLAGCLTDADRIGNGIRNKPVAVPAMKDAAVAVAARVDQAGRQLLGQNPFLGVDPTFHTLGRAEPEIFHPDLNGLFVTEGLVDRCKTDAELSAVLATELGRMAAERRAGDRMRLPSPMQQVPDAGGLTPGGAGSDPTQMAVQAVFDKQQRRDRRDRPPSEEPRAAAADILKGAGVDVKSLDAVAPLLQEAARNHGMADQLGGRGSNPRWSN